MHLDSFFRYSTSPLKVTITVNGIKRQTRETEGTMWSVPPEAGETRAINIDTPASLETLGTLEFTIA